MTEPEPIPGIHTTNSDEEASYHVVRPAPRRRANRWPRGIIMMILLVFSVIMGARVNNSLHGAQYWYAQVWGLSIAALWWCLGRWWFL